MNRYPVEKMKENSAKALGKDLPISTKQSVNICAFLRGKSLADAKEKMQKVIQKKVAVPYTRFNADLGHKTGIGPGRYPEKASKLILMLLEEAEANAQFKGLNTSQLKVAHISANRAARPWRFGRKRRIKTKRTHITIVLEESADIAEKKAKKESKSKEKNAPKKDANQEAKK
jgi:large subunit ribosomal protein L22